MRGRGKNIGTESGAILGQSWILSVLSLEGTSSNDVHKNFGLNDPLPLDNVTTSLLISTVVYIGPHFLSSLCRHHLWIVPELG